MKKRLIILLLLAVLVVSMTAFVACDQTGNPPDGGGTNPPIEYEEAYLPVYVKFDGVSIVSWTRVDPNAIYDEIDINGTVIKVDGTSFDLTKCDVKPANRKFEVKVRSVVRENELVSDWTYPLNFTCEAKLSIPVLQVKDNTLTWNTDANAKSINVSVNGTAKEYELSQSVDLSSYEGNVRIVANFVGDGIVFANSEKISLEYDTELGQTRSLPVSSVSVKGLQLTYLGAIGTEEYHLTDTVGNTIITKSPVYQMDNKLLIVSIRAYSKNYGYSTPVTVNYFTEGDGTKENPYLISTPEQFRYIDVYEALGQSCYYKLTQDIAFKPTVLEGDAIGFNLGQMSSFSGHLDGDGHVVSNITIHDPNGYLALFQNITSGATISNITFDATDLKTWSMPSGDNIMHEKGGHVALLAYTNHGTIDNVHITNSKIEAVKDGAAALVSLNYGTVSNCTVDRATTITGVNEVGGIVIYNEGTVANCINNASVTGSKFVGGIVGRNTGKVTMCQNTGAIVAGNTVGGIVGYNYNEAFQGAQQYNPVVELCHNSGTIAAQSRVGGVVGQNGSDGTMEFGFQSVSGGKIQNCYNTGNITAGGLFGGVAGGVVGANYSSNSNGGVYSCYNAGTVTVKEGNAPANRVYVDITSAPSWTESDGATIYIYMWNTNTDAPYQWPGTAMTRVEMDGKILYYFDMTQDYKYCIFVRVSPAGETWAQTADLTKSSSLYVLKSFGGASGGYWEDTMVAGGSIAGISHTMNNCYTLENCANVISNKNGTLFPNTVNNCSTVAATQVADGALADLLNGTEGTAWTTSEGKIVLAWQVAEEV